MNISRALENPGHKGLGNETCRYLIFVGLGFEPWVKLAAFFLKLIAKIATCLFDEFKSGRPVQENVHDVRY